MFVRDAGTFAQHLADSDGYAPFGDFANGSVRLHFGLTPRTADDDAAARDLEEAHDPALMGARVRAAIVAIELQEARRAAEFAAIGPQQAKRVADFTATISPAAWHMGVPPSNKRPKSRLCPDGARLTRADVMDTDAPGWGRYDEMNDEVEDYGDIADAWMYYDEMIAERMRHTALGPHADDDPWVFGDPSHVPGGQYIKRYDSDECGDQMGIG